MKLKLSITREWCKALPAGVAIKAAVQKTAAALDTAVRVGVLGALTLAAAGKVLDLY